MKAFKNITIRRLVIGLLPFYLFTFLPLHAQVGTWRNHLAYHDVQQIQAAGNELFVMASNGLYQYNKADQSIYTYDKTKGLSDTYITNIRWCQQARRLVTVYSSSNIDLIETNGKVTNISDIYTKTITGGKDIHNLTIRDIYAYLACDFGIVKLNAKAAEISESYLLGFIVTAIAFEGNNIYAQSKDKGVWMADMSKNLIDPSNWTQTDTYPSFEPDNTDYDNNIDLVKTLNPGGPQYNYFYESKFVNGKLYTTGGGFMTGQIQLDHPGIIQIWDNNNWTIYPTNLQETTGVRYQDMNCIDIDPTDANHVMVGGRTGLYEFNNGQFLKLHNKNNSPIRTAMDGNRELSDNYTFIHGMKYDNAGNLWLLNSQAKDVNLLMFSKSGEWVKHTNNDLFEGNNVSKPVMRCVMIDSRGLLWFVNTHFGTPSLHCYNMGTNQMFSYSNWINQDGTSYSYCYPYDVKEDLSGNIWIATNKGPFYIKSNEVGKNDATLYQEKVPRNDGTDLADYLLSGLDVRSIAIDGAGRKWIGTAGNGVFLISEDNMTQIYHFTTENSYLISNNINYISIDPQKGEVFFLTDKGLCSYISDATQPSEEMTKDKVWAYPNPVRSDYTGLITIVGLTLNADVKILASNGALVYEGRSNGGTFTWNGCDREGRRVTSGIYMVATATSEGEKGTVCKIAIIR